MYASMAATSSSFTVTVAMEFLYCLFVITQDRFRKLIKVVSFVSCLSLNLK